MLYYFKAFFDYVWSRRGEFLDYMREEGFFEHRADQPGYDWITFDFPVAGTWYDLDLTAIVPEHAKAVLFRIVLRSTAAGNYCAVRRKGYTQNKVASYVDVSVANMYEREDIIVGIDTDRIVQAVKQQAQINAMLIVVKGWWW